MVESFYPYVSGVSRRFSETIAGLAKRGHKIIVLTGSPKSTEWQSDFMDIRQNVTIEIMPSSNAKEMMHNDLFLLSTDLTAIFSTIRRSRPDIVHVAEVTPASILCAIICKYFFQVPVVWSVHSDVQLYIEDALSSTWSPFRRTISMLYQLVHDLFLSCCSDLKLTVSKHSALKLARKSQHWLCCLLATLYRSHHGKPYEVWYTGVDTELFTPKWRVEFDDLKISSNGKTRSEVMLIQELSKDKVIMLTVGRLSHEKNLPFLARLVESCSDVFLIVVGDGHRRSDVQSLFPKGRAYFTGLLVGRCLAQAYASADFFVSASVSETFGQMYLEAIASGTPVVAARSGQLSEFLDENVNAWFWEPDDLSSAMETVAKARKANQRVARERARRAALKHSWEKVTQQTEKLYLATLIDHHTKWGSSVTDIISFYATGCFAAFVFLCGLLVYTITSSFASLPRV